MRHILLLAFFFLFGFNKVVLYGPVFIALGLYILIDIRQRNLKIEWCSIILSFLFFAYLIMNYLSPNIKVIGPNKLLVKMLLINFLCLYVNSVKKYSIDKLNYLMAFVGGTTTLMVLYIFYNIFIKTGGRSLIYNPFSSKIENSPYISNLIALSSSFYLPFLFIWKDKSKKVLTGSLIVLFTYFAVILKTRVYIILITFSLLTLLISFIVKRKVKASIIIFYLFCVTLFSFLLFNTNNGIELIKRFQSSSFVRFYLILDGLEKFIKNPLGGFSPSKDILDTPWFHNLFLDTARLSGLPGLLIIFLIIFYVLFNSSRVNLNNSKRLIFWSWVLSITLMFQDVVLEGISALFVVFMMSSFFLTDEGSAQ